MYSFSLQGKNSQYFLACVIKRGSKTKQLKRTRTLIESLYVVEFRCGNPPDVPNSRRYVVNSAEVYYRCEPCYEGGGWVRCPQSGMWSPIPICIGKAEFFLYAISFYFLQFKYSVLCIEGSCSICFMYLEEMANSIHTKLYL